MADTQANDQEKQIKKLKRKLEGWREVILPLHSVLIWEEKWYPGVILGGVSGVFLLLWLVDPPVFTILALLGLIATLMDYLVPILISHLYTPDSWNKNKEKLFEDICRNLVLSYNTISGMVESFYKMREVSPRMYYTILILSLGSLAWVGTTTSNLLLMYMSALYLCFLPGLLNHNLVGTHLVRVFNSLGNILQPHAKLE